MQDSRMRTGRSLTACRNVIGVGGGRAWQGGMHGWGDICGRGMHGGGMHGESMCCWGACMEGGMCGRGMHGRGCAWWGGYVWQGGMCGRGACVVGGGVMYCK